VISRRTVRIYIEKEPGGGMGPEEDKRAVEGRNNGSEIPKES